MSSTGHHLKDRAVGAIKNTIELVGIAARITQSVPYLGAISAALTEFAKIQEVSQPFANC